MSNATAVAPERATKAPARAKAAPPTAINNEVDILVAKVATIIGDLVKVVVESPFSDEYAARNAFLEADALLMGLAAPPGPNDYWDESKPRKPIADQMLAIDGYLKQAVAALLNDEAQRPGERLFRLSMAEQASALIAQLHEAYEGLPGTSAALAALTDFQQPIAGARQFRDRPSPPIRRVETVEPGQVTAATFSHQAGEKGTTMVIRCAYDIEAIAEAVTNLGDEAASNDEHAMAALLRCYGNRVSELNSMVISHLDRDNITLSEVQYAMYRGAQRLPAGALE